MELSAQLHGPDVLSRGKRGPCTHQKGGWEGHSQSGCGGKEISPGPFENRTPVVQSIAVTLMTELAEFQGQEEVTGVYLMHGGLNAEQVCLLVTN